MSYDPENDPSALARMGALGFRDRPAPPPAGQGLAGGLQRMRGEIDSLDKRVASLETLVRVLLSERPPYSDVKEA